MSEFNTSHVVYETGGVSLRIFLLSRLQPWRWDIMLANGGIRAQHGGKNIEHLTADTMLSQGDVVFIDPAYGRTWMELRRKASADFRDYVFCPQRVPKGEKDADRFLTNEVKALLDGQTAIDIDPKEAPTLTALIPQLTPLAKSPIRHLILVSHANPFGNINMPVKDANVSVDDPTAGDLNWETLNECIADGSLRIEGRGPNPIVLPRPENSNGERIPCAVVIRGCSSGVHRILLKKIQEAFGPQVDAVVMPRYFDAADYIGSAPSPALLEYFTHRFIVTSKTPLNRDGVIDAFRAARLKDWLDNPVPDHDWNDLVPQNVDRAARTKALPMPIEGRQEAGSFSARFEPRPLESLTKFMTQKEKPSPEHIKEFIVKGWKGLPAFKDPVWPFWKRMGFGIKSEDDFIAFWNYELNPDPKYKAQWAKGKWGVRAMRYSFEIRTPLVDRTMICKYIPNGERGTPSNNIDYNDDRIFGRYEKIPPHYAQKL